METVEGLLPDFVQSCRQSKVAGIFGKELRIIGKNRETLMRESNLSSYNKSL
jgi:hypothetical protein